jgi:rhodanese-related sulfurtransferase
MQELAEFTSANPWLAAGLVASALAVIFYELRLKARDIGSLGTAVAVRMINNGSVVVDARSPENYAAGHIVDARNITETELLDQPDNLGKKKSALLVCDNGQRSSELVAKLRKGGLENIFSLKGGLAAWQQENLPVVRDSAG